METVPGKPLSRPPGASEGVERGRRRTKTWEGDMLSHAILLMGVTQHLVQARMSPLV